MKVSAILLAGGKGVRMGGGALPKQLLPLQNKALALYSLETLLQVEEIQEVIVVCAPEYRHYFSGFPVSFAPPGEQRQDSVYSGLQAVAPSSDWTCIHDAARPFITPSSVELLFKEGLKTGAASLAVPAKNTLKEVQIESQHVVRTIDRSCIWEIQTPQLLTTELLRKGFDYLHTQSKNVTDDVSLAELIGHPVQLVRGPYQNIKITTPEDLLFAQWLVQNNKHIA